MNLAPRILVLFMCVSLCAGGAMLARKASAKEERSKTKVVPINNRATPNRVWLWS
jgi:hypothetical protein